ncbi:MAG: CvpA family protein [Balneolales bacterium]|nr:CvpA family protein [Balneolales bacterium]
MPFSYVDLIIAIPLAAMFIKGMKNGFAHEVLALVGQVVAIFLSFTYMEEVGSSLSSIFGFTGAGVPLVAFIMIYVIFIILVHIVIKAVNSFIKVVFLSTFNMMMGGVFSTFKALLLLSVVFLLLAGFNKPSVEAQRSSFLYSYVVPVAPSTYNFVAIVFPGITSFADEAGTFIERNNPFKDLNELDN